MIRLFGHYVPAPLVVLMLAEGAAVFASVYAGVVLPYIALPLVTPVSWTRSALPTATLLALLVVISIDLAGLSDARRRFRRAEVLLRLLAAFALAYLIIAVLGYLVPSLRLARQAYLLSFTVGFPTVLVMRSVHARLTAATRPRRKVLLLGSGPLSELISKLARPDTGYEVVGCVNGKSSATEEANGLKVLGTVDDLAWVVKTLKPDVVVAAMEERRAALPIDTILQCKLQGVEVADWPAFYERLTTKLLVSQISPSWLAFSDGFHRSRLHDALKRTFDLTVGLVGCLISFPVLLLLTVLIKLDSNGPVFFRQERVGKNGRVFSLVKLRTMRANAEERSGPVWAAAGDARITRVGRFLRKTRLDETPQFFNVLFGDMSLVGPRPERPAFTVQLQEHLPFYMHRHVVKPGITGWAQVRYPYGASIDDAREKLEYDLYYVKNRSLFLDLLIIVETVQVVLFGRGGR